MSEGLLTVVTVVEAVVLVAVLAFFLIIITKLLRSIANTLAEVAWGARAVERQLRATKSNVQQINAGLTDIATVAPGIVEMAEQFARGGVRS
ncbi:MAG: hypothetical protein ACRDMZ_10465 [Solirubrobacteraceae bacterium]